MAGRPKKEPIQPVIEETPQPIPQRVKPVIVETRAMPQTRAYAAPVHNSDTITLVNLKKGNVFTVSRANGERMVRQHPNEFRKV